MSNILYNYIILGHCYKKTFSLGGVWLSAQCVPGQGQVCMLIIPTFYYNILVCNNNWKKFHRN